MSAVLEIVNGSKSYPGVLALDQISMTVGEHEVVGIIGENGAGKSTLVKILTGVIRLDSGEIRMNGKKAEIANPRDAARAGIALVFQEQSIIPTMNVAENIFLGREAEFTVAGFLDKRKMNAAAKRELAKVQLDVDPRTMCRDLSFAERQMVELAKALSLDERNDGHLVVMLDEPTSVLETREIEILFKLINELRTRASFVFISHRLDEVLAISDRIYVMRDGTIAGEMKAAEASIPEMHRLMVGRELHREYYREQLQGTPGARVVLEAKAIGRAGAFHDISFALREGEVLGIAGVIGSGREALVRSLAGFEPVTEGEIRIDGTAVRLDSPRKAQAHGIGYVPRERRAEGIVGLASVAENMTLASIKTVAPRLFIRFGEERDLARRWIERLRIKTPSSATPAGGLSGGNQQKVVLSKWRIAGSRIMILDHPTRGVDVGAKEDVYELVREMTRDGLSVILLADTIEEIIGLSHTILVMRDGAITARFDAPAGGKPSQVDLVSHMV
jgi:ribose transport system ATP-binding protein